MWISRKEYTQLVASAADNAALTRLFEKNEVMILEKLSAAYAKVDELALKIAKLEATNLDLQDKVVTARSQQQVLAPNVGFAGLFEEDPEDVAEMLRELERDGRDAVLLKYGGADNATNN